MLIDAQTDILIIAVVLAVISQILQRTLINKKEMKEKQKEMKEKQKKLKELYKKEDAKSKKQIEALNKEIMAGLSASMGGMFKLMAVSLVIYSLVFAYLAGDYANAVITIPFALPFLGSELSWYWWYVVTAVVASLVINGILKVVESGLLKK